MRAIYRHTIASNRCQHSILFGSKFQAKVTYGQFSRPTLLAHIFPLSSHDSPFYACKYATSLEQNQIVVTIESGSVHIVKTRGGELTILSTVRSPRL